MRKTNDFNDSDAEFVTSLPIEAGAADSSGSPTGSVEEIAEPEVLDASAVVAGGVPADEFDVSLVMAGGVPQVALAPDMEPAPAPVLNLGEDPVEQNRQRILRRKLWEALLQPSYWDNAKALLLKKAEQGGLRTDIGISGDAVIFAVKGSGLAALLQPPKITFDLDKGTIRASGKGLSMQSLAAAYIECGIAAGYKQMWFEGGPDFMRIVSEMARANGIEVISKSECAAARKLRNLENDDAVQATPKPLESAYDPVDEEMSTRAFR